VKPTRTSASRSPCGRPDGVSDLSNLGHSRVLTDRLEGDNRSRFLKHLDASFTLANTIVFAVVDGHEPKTQALIAPAIIDSGYFYLQQCAERETEAHNQIGGYGTVDWGTSGMPGWNMGSDAA
jgi:hypothetical protein